MGGKCGVGTLKNGFFKVPRTLRFLLEPFRIGKHRGSVQQKIFGSFMVKNAACRYTKMHCTKFIPDFRTHYECMRGNDCLLLL